MASLFSFGSMTPRAHTSLRVVGLLSSCLLVLLLVGAASAAPSKASAGKISAHLTKTSFKSSQAGSVKLIYKFSATSKSFAYKLTIKKGSKWLKVKSVKKTGSFKGSKSMTVKKVFAGKSVKVGSYRLKLSADGGSKTLGFKIAVVGRRPIPWASPAISGDAIQNQTLTATKGTWRGSPTSFTYRWKRCRLGCGSECSYISGATSSSYVLQADDVSHTMVVVVTARNAYGSASAESRPTTFVDDLRATPEGRGLPISVNGIATAIQISVGDRYTCAVLMNKSVKCWGLNDHGQLGDGTTTSRAVPVSVTGITDAIQVSAGSSHTCAVLSDHTVKCWGTNANGELGDGTTTPSSTPVSVSGITNATAVSAGGYHTCALLSDSTIKCWGDNSYGQLGDGSYSNDHPAPVVVSGITGATQISAGGRHTCALLSNSSIECWGQNSSGQIGDGTTNTRRVSPVQVSGITTATQISAGEYYTCARLTDGSIKCWGANSRGQLGNDTTSNSSTAVSVGGITTAIQISAGWYHTCAVLSDHTVKCWGANYKGQLGNGTRTSSSVPVSVSSISTASEVGAGSTYDHSCALLSNDAIKCWGANSDGQLGNGYFEEY